MLQCLPDNIYHYLLTSVMILFLGSALCLISSFHATSPFPGSLSYTYHHYLLILGPLTFTVNTPSNPYTILCIIAGQGIFFASLFLVMNTYSSS